MEGVVCYGVMVPSRQPGEGPYAASITLLKVRATAERVPAPDRGPALARRRRCPIRCTRTSASRRAGQRAAGRRLDRASRRRRRRARRSLRPAVSVAGGADDLVDTRRRAGRPASRTRTAADPGPKALEAAIHERREVADRPGRPVRLGDEARRACTRRSAARRTGARRAAHGSVAPSRIGGLARWSITKRQPGHRPRRRRAPPAARAAGPAGRRRGRPPRPPPSPRRTSARSEPVGIGLVVDLVADAHEPVAARARRAARRSCRRRAGSSGRPSR